MIKLFAASEREREREEKQQQRWKLFCDSPLFCLLSWHIFKTLTSSFLIISLGDAFQSLSCGTLSFQPESMCANVNTYTFCMDRASFICLPVICRLHAMWHMGQDLISLKSTSSDDDDDHNDSVCFFRLLTLILLLRLMGCCFQCECWTFFHKWHKIIIK